MKLALLASVGLTCSLVAATVSAKADSVVHINNKSAWDIHHLFISPADTTEWGPDQLGEHVIGSGSSFELSAIPCGKYDLRLVDEDGDECVVDDVKLCADEAAWDVTDEELLHCEKATKEVQKVESDVHINNQSAWDIHHLFLSPTDTTEWGPDQLGEHVIGTGTSFDLSGVPCAEYDLRLVDEDGDECVVGDVKLCADQAAWVITDKDLLHCQEATEAAQEADGDDK